VHVAVAKLSEIPAAFASVTWSRRLEANASVRIRAAIHEIQPTQAVTPPVLEISDIQTFFDAAVDGIEHRNAAAVPLVVNECAAVRLACRGVNTEPAKFVVYELAWERGMRDLEQCVCVVCVTYNTSWAGLLDVMRRAQYLTKCYNKTVI
jgi:hypothetical protein